MQIQCITNKVFFKGLMINKEIKIAIFLGRQSWSIETILFPYSYISSRVTSLLYQPSVNSNEKLFFVFAQVVPDNWYDANLTKNNFKSMTIRTKRLTSATTAATTICFTFAAIAAKVHAERGVLSRRQKLRRATVALSRYDLSAEYLSTDRALHDVSKPRASRISYWTNRGAESTTFGYRPFLRTRRPWCEN